MLVVTHAAGVVHRDLKPGNVMITPAGDVKVLDFGLARSLPAAGGSLREEDDAGGEDQTPSTRGDAATGVTAPRAAAPTPHGDAGEPALAGPDPVATDYDPAHLETERGALLGTLAYMSPEQARGETATTASDLYSFGLLLQELFTGRSPVPAGDDSAALLERARRGDVPAAEGHRRGPRPAHPAPEVARAVRAAHRGGHARAPALDRGEACAPRPAGGHGGGARSWRCSP